MKRFIWLFVACLLSVTPAFAQFSGGGGGASLPNGGITGSVLTRDPNGGIYWGLPSGPTGVVSSSTNIPFQAQYQNTDYISLTDGSTSISAARFINGPDGNIWGIDNANNGSLFAVSPQGRQVASLTPPQLGTDCFTLGGDGNFWVGTGNWQTGVYRISPTGTVLWATTVPSGSGDTTAMTTDANGNVWGTTRNGILFTVDVAQTFTEYTPSSDRNTLAGNNGLIIGADGNIWGSCYGTAGNFVFKFDVTSHQFTYFATSSLCTAFVLGADKYIYCNAPGGACKIDVNGNITTMQDFNGNAGTVALGPDGTIWEGTANSTWVGHWSSTGAVVSRYTCPIYFDPLVSGPDGNLWGVTTYNSAPVVFRMNFGYGGIEIANSNLQTSSVTLLPSSVSNQNADCTSAALTLTLCPANQFTNKAFTFTKIDSSANALTISAAGADKINGAASQTITSQWGSMTLWSDGTSWHIRCRYLTMQPRGRRQDRLAA